MGGVFSARVQGCQTSRVTHSGDFVLSATLEHPGLSWLSPHKAKSGNVPAQLTLTRSDVRAGTAQRQQKGTVILGFVHRDSHPAQQRPDTSSRDLGLSWRDRSQHSSELGWAVQLLRASQQPLGWAGNKTAPPGRMSQELLVRASEFLQFCTNTDGATPAGHRVPHRWGTNTLSPLSQRN